MFIGSFRETAPWGEQSGKAESYAFIGSSEDLDYIRRQYPAIKNIFLNQEGPLCYVVTLNNNARTEDRPPEKINGIGVWM